MPKTRILFVDDDVLTLSLMQKLAEIQGYQGECCQSAALALAQLPVLQPDLVLVDLHLQEMSGLDFVRQVRQTETMKDLPVVVLTAGMTQEDSQQARSAGAQTLLYKPLGFEALKSVVQEYVVLHPNAV